MAQRQDLQPSPRLAALQLRKAGQLRRLEAAVDAGVVRARVGQAQGFRKAWQAARSKASSACR